MAGGPDQGRDAQSTHATGGETQGSNLTNSVYSIQYWIPLIYIFCSRRMLVSKKLASLFSISKKCLAFKCNVKEKNRILILQIHTYMYIYNIHRMQIKDCSVNVSIYNCSFFLNEAR